MSQSKAHFEAALVDVNNLMDFHAWHGGDGRGRRAGNLQSLNKAAVVLLCAAWESYIESILRECAERSIAAAGAPEEMIKPLSKLVGDHIRGHKNESAWVSAAGDGWRSLTRSVIANRVGAFNTPKKGPISEIFSSTLGVKEIDRNWEWHKCPRPMAANRLDDFVKLRGGIAHGDRTLGSVNKSHVDEGIKVTGRLVEKIEERLVAEGLLDA